MSKLSAKIVKPISIRITEKNIVFSCVKNKEHNLETTVDINSEHYGFTIVNCIDELEYEKTYPTQGKISKIELNEGILCIHEFGKFLPWKFNNNGEIMQNPTIPSMYGIEVEYPTDTEKSTMNVYIKR